MTEELVTLETAKLLKEKGFNEYCKYIINDKGLMMETIFNVSSTNSKQSKLCINSPLHIDARLLWKQAISSNSP